MRIFKPLLLAISVALILPSQSSAIDIPVSFQVQGAGYGHGVGMSQIGARAKAIAGETATAIISYYYKDVAIEPLDDTKILRAHRLGNGRRGQFYDVFVGECPIALRRNRSRRGGSGQLLQGAHGQPSSNHPLFDCLRSLNDSHSRPIFLFLRRGARVFESQPRVPQLPEHRSGEKQLVH